MAIGTEVKIGWNAVAVRAGFGALRGMFAGTMRGFRQMGIGAARAIGARMTDILGRVLMAIPHGIKDTLDWAGNLTDMSAQTRVAVEDLIVMEEALRNAGASGGDTSRMLSTLANNLYEARKAAGPARDALHELGFIAGDFKGLSLLESFEKLGKNIANLPADFEGLESIMGDLFGARMGYKLIRFFRDYDNGMEQAWNNVGDLAVRVNETAAGYDKMSDAIGRFQNRWRELMTILIDLSTSLLGTDWIDKMFDELSPEKVRTAFVYVREQLRSLMSGDFMKDMFRNVGKMIGEGILLAMKSLNPVSMIKGFFTPGPSASNGGSGMDHVAAKIDQSNKYLQQLTTKKVGWA